MYIEDHSKDNLEKYGEFFEERERCMDSLTELVNDLIGIGKKSDKETQTQFTRLLAELERVRNIVINLPYQIPELGDLLGKYAYIYEATNRWKVKD